jgi:acetolactate synthase-1/2/3 large subunit
MADGYSRASGRPGVCLAVCGPGVLNAATPLATAFTDSVPFLLVSGQTVSGSGPRSGYYHENDQLSAVATFTKHRCRVERPQDVVTHLDRAWCEMTTGRPGPVLLEVPVDVQRAEHPADPFPPIPDAPVPLSPRPGDIAALADLLGRWKKPLILAGGGVISAGAESLLVRVAERLGAPMFHTGMGKCAFPGDHALACGLTWKTATSDLTNMASFFSPLFAECDGLLAVGCRFSQLTTGSWSLPKPPALAHIDIDAEEIGRHYPATLGLHADAAEALRLLLDAMSPTRRPCWTPLPRPSGKSEVWRLPGFELFEALRRGLPPDAIVSADVTRLGYMMMAQYPLTRPRTFLHPAGYVSMGFGIPAALAAKVAFPDRVVVAVVGDGGFLMSGMELATAVQERLPVVVILVNDRALTLIKMIQQRRYESRFLGVDLHNPDFGLFARAFGVRHWLPDDDAAFEAALREAIATREPAVIEVCPRDAP